MNHQDYDASKDNTMITLYEVDEDRLAIENDGVLGEVEIPQSWQTTGFGGGSFEHAAEEWLAGNWEPGPFDDTKLFRRKSPVATWSPEDGLQYLRRPLEMLPLTRAYIGITL